MVQRSNSYVSWVEKPNKAAMEMTVVYTSYPLLTFNVLMEGEIV